MDLTIGKDLAGCLSSFDVTVRNYFNGRASDAEVRSLFDCASQSFDLFRKFTRGEKTGQYLPEELRHFFTQYFLGDKRITDELLKEAMTLKQAILGGSNDALTFDELNTVIGLLKLLKSQALVMNRFMPIESEHFNDLRGSELQAAFTAITQSGQTLGSFLTRASLTYNLQNLSNLLLQIQPLIENGGEGLGPRILRDNLEVFGAVKGLIFGGPNDSITPADWTKIAAIGSRWYSLYLRLNNVNARQYQNWRKKTGDAESIYHSEALTDFAALGEETYNLLLESLSQHSAGTVQFKDVHHLVDSLTEPSRDNWKAYDASQAWRPFDVEFSGYVKSTVVNAVQHLLGGYETTPTGRNAPGLTAPLFERAWGEFSSWFTQQKYLERTYLQLGGSMAFDSPGFAREQILAIPALEPKEFQLFKNFEVAPNLIRNSILDMRDVIQNFRPLFAGKDNKVYFPDAANDPLGTLYSYSNLSTLNWIRSASRLVMQGYVKAKDVERARSYGGLTVDELDHVYWDFRSFAVKLGILDPTTTMSGLKRFQEANLFTSNANGDNMLSLNEGTELFAFLISAGGISAQVHQDISKMCPVGAKDEFGNYEIDITCYRKQFGNALQSRQWSQMPGMVKYFSRLTPAQKDDFTATLVVAAQGSAADSEMINHFQTDTMVMIPHYIESVFNRFDVDHSGTLDVTEALTAFPVFRGILLQFPPVKAAGFTSDEDLQAIFTYLLKEGRSPTTAEFLYWRYIESWNGKVHADRSTLLKIFALLANS